MSETRRVSLSLFRLIPLDRGAVDMYFRYSEKTGELSLEVLLPPGMESVFAGLEHAAHMQQIRNVCRSIEESVEETEIGERVRCRLVFRHSNR